METTNAKKELNFLRWALEVANQEYDGNVKNMAIAMNEVYNEN